MNEFQKLTTEDTFTIMIVVKDTEQFKQQNICAIWSRSKKLNLVFCSRDLKKKMNLKNIRYIFAKHDAQITNPWSFQIHIYVCIKW